MAVPPGRRRLTKSLRPQPVTSLAFFGPARRAQPCRLASDLVACLLTAPMRTELADQPADQNGPPTVARWVRYPRASPTLSAPRAQVTPLPPEAGERL